MVFDIGYSKSRYSRSVRIETISGHISLQADHLNTSPSMGKGTHGHF